MIDIISIKEIKQTDNDGQFTGQVYLTAHIEIDGLPLAVGRLDPSLRDIHQHLDSRYGELLAVAKKKNSSRQVIDRPDLKMRR